MQQPVKRVQIVIAGLADMAQRGFQLRGAVQHNPLAERGSRHRDTSVHSVNSVPSAGICQPARSAILRSAEPCSSAGLELLICRNTFLSISSPARAAIAPLSPDIAFCPCPSPVLLPRPATINSSSRHTVPSKNTSGAPASRDLSASETPAQAARKYKNLPVALSRMRSPSVSPTSLSPAGCALPSRYHALLPATANGKISMPEGEPSGSVGSSVSSSSIG